ncbi:MAG: hypothetical protein DMF61_21485 [Blastocatellia bacterium AA13]|nr:MAG: hypothetical protein DMF61_21485 [Blastocatellia bacterium AA13]
MLYSKPEKRRLCISGWMGSLNADRRVPSLTTNPLKIPVATRLLLFLPSEAFLVKAKGDSMAPRITAGDLVIARRRVDAEDGQIVVCVNEDEG